MKKAQLLTIAALAFLAGCGSVTNEPPGIPVQPKWAGAPYRLAVGPQPARPNPAGLSLPAIQFTANPEALQTRADLVMRIDTSGVKKPGAVVDQLIMMPTDISGAQGRLPAPYLDVASKELAKMLGAYCLKGKVKIEVALVKSSIMMTASDAQVNAHCLSDWLPLEIEFKNPHPKC